MLSIFESIRIPIAPGKTQGPSQMLEFMSILLDTVKMQASLSPDKVEKLRSIFENFQQKRSCTLKQLQSLIGTLNFACKVVPPRRPFLQRMIAHTRNIKEQHHHVKLNSADCYERYIKTHTTTLSGVSAMLVNTSFLQFYFHCIQKSLSKLSEL